MICQILYITSYFPFGNPLISRKCISQIMYYEAHHEANVSEFQENLKGIFPPRDMQNDVYGKCIMLHVWKSLNPSQQVTHYVMADDLNMRSISSGMLYRGNMSSRFAINSEAFASELIENLENVFTVVMVGVVHEQRTSTLFR